MCLNPLYIRSSTHLVGRKSLLKGKIVYKPSDKVRAFYNIKGSLYGYHMVPCGTCVECLRNKQNSILQRCDYMTRDYIVYFGTLTYNNEHLPRYTASNGYVYNYADPRHFALAVKRIRKAGLIPEGCKYLLVTEYGGQKHRPHFHFLFYVPKAWYLSQGIPQYILDDPKKFPLWSYRFTEQFYWAFRNEWRVNVADGNRWQRSRNPKWEPLFTYRERIRNGKFERNYDFHLIEYREETAETAVAAYVSKYVLKFDEWIDKKVKQLYYLFDNTELRLIRSLIRPKLLTSKGFGFIWQDYDEFYNEFKKELGRYIDSSLKDDFLRWYSPVDGRSQPLSKYYKRKLMLLQHYIARHLNIYGSLEVSAEPPEDRHTRLRQLRQDNSEFKRAKFEELQEYLSMRNYDFYEAVDP